MGLTLFRACLKLLIRLVYRLRVLGRERLPREGGALMIANHVTWLDALILSTVCPRRIRFVVFEDFFGPGIIGWFVRLFDSVPISQKHSRQAIKTVAEAIKAGAIVCIFPEGMLTRTGLMNELRKGFELILRQAGDAPLLPVYLDNLWGSVFSYADGRFFRKKPRHLPYGVTVNFGQAIRASEAREALLRLGWEAFRARRMPRSLPAALIPALGGNRGGTCCVDRTSGQSQRLSRRQVAVTAMLFAARWKDLPGERVGLALPPGASSLLAHLGLVLAGKTPVSLPLGCPRSDMPKLAKALRDAGVETIITTQRIKLKALPLPWTKHVVRLEDAVRMSGTIARGISWLKASFLPARFWTKPRGGPESEAISFLENSGAEWSYRFLSHREILCNIAQVSEANLLRAGELIACHYEEHSLPGQIFGFWLPLIRHYRPAFFEPNGESAKPLVMDEPATSVVADQVGLEFLAKISLEEPLGLRQILTFEPYREDDIGRRIEQSRHVMVCHGWVSSALKAIVTLSMTHPVTPDGSPTEQIGHRAGAVGRFLPGFIPRIQEADASGRGLLVGRGPCQDEDQALGTTGRIDAEGFLFLESNAPGVRQG